MRRHDGTLRVVGVRRHRGDHHVPLDTEALRGVGEQECGVAVDCELPLGAAVRAGAGGEDDRVDAAEAQGELVVVELLEVGHECGRACCSTSGTCAGFRTIETASCPASVRLTGEEEGDLPVASAMAIFMCPILPVASGRLRRLLT